MRRPLGVIIISILHLLVGLAYSAVLAAIVFALFSEEWNSEQLPITVILFPVGSLALGATLFLASTVGIWQMREWGRWLTVVVVGVVIVLLVISFFERLRYFYSDILGRWDFLSTVTLLPYSLALWPIQQVAAALFPEFAYEAGFLAKFSLGITLNALIICYLLSVRVKQAFGAAP